MEKKKILVLTTTFPRWKDDSTPGFVYDLSDRLTSKYDIIVLAPHYKDAQKKETIGKLKIRRFRYFFPDGLQKLCYDGGIIPNMKKSFLVRLQMPFLILSEFFASSDLIKKEQIDMVHAHWILPQGLVGVILKKLFKIPLLVTIHGSDLFPLKNIFFKKLHNFIMKNADKVTVNSIATKNELVKRFPGFSSKIDIISMGVDTNLFKKRITKKPIQYSKNKILLVVGRLSDQKGLRYLVEAMPDIIKHEPKVKLLVIGEGPYDKILQEKSQELGIGKHVKFLGAMPTQKIATYYNFADIFVMPSLSTKTGTEALGLSLLEAMASGCTVIGTDVGGIPSAIKNNYNGILIKQKDKKVLSSSIITLLENTKKSMNLGNKAAEFVKKNYSWNKISQDFMKIYEGLTK